jgi:hypothetical protein
MAFLARVDPQRLSFHDVAGSLRCLDTLSEGDTAAAHLAELADYLDIDGSLLITNDPYHGATAECGVVSFANAPGRTGLRVAAR